MAERVEKFRDMSGDEPDWRFITDNLVMHTDTRPCLSPRIFVGEQLVMEYYGDKGERRTGTPSGHASWEMNTVSDTQFIWPMSFFGVTPHFAYLIDSDKSWTLCFMFRPRSTTTRNGLCLRLIFASTTQYEFYYNGNAITWAIKEGGAYNLSVTQPRIVGQWHMLQATSHPGFARTLSVWSADGTYLTNTQYPQSRVQDLSQGLNSAQMGDDDKENLQATMAGLILTKGYWTVAQTNMWAAQPHGWANEYNHRGITFPATCLQAGAGVEQSVLGEAGLGVPISGSVEAGPAVEGVGSMGGSTEGEASLYPTTEGTAKFCRKRN